MRWKTNLVICLLAISMMFGANPIHADGDAPERPITSTEKAYIGKVLGTIHQALPKPLANWSVTEKPSTTPPKAVPEKSERGPFRVRYKGQWFDQAQKQRQSQLRMAAMAKAAPQEQARKAYAVKDACLQVEVTLNQTTVGLRKATTFDFPGVSRTFMVDDGNPGMEDCPYGKAIVLLGAWDNGRPGGE